MRMVQLPLSICGLDEIAEFLKRGVTHVISILDPEYPYPEELLVIPEGNRLVLRFDDATLAQADRIYPVKGDMERLIKWVKGLADETGVRLLIHCHAGVSRSTAAAAITMASLNPGHESEIFEHIDDIRSRNWPNSLMVNIADELLGCGGALNSALRAHHERRATRDPELAELIIRHGRAHEVPNSA